MRNVTAAIFVSLLTVSIVLAQTATKPADPVLRTETVDAQIASGRLVALSESQLTLATKTGAAKIALDDLAEMRVSVAPNPLSGVGSSLVMTAAGHHVTGSAITFADGKVNFTNSSLGKLTMDFSRVAAVYIPTKRQSAADG